MKLGRLFLFFVLIITAASCGKKDSSQKQAPPPAVNVNTDTVQEGVTVYYDNYPATITALTQVDIKPQVSGNITGVFFHDGDHVRKGEKLYSIDPQQYAGAYDQAAANVDVAKANLVKAQKNADRYIELQKNDAIASQTVDNALADLEAAKMQVAAAQANVQSVQTNLKYTTIYSPIDGTIGISQVKIGTSVYPQTLLNTISTDDPIAADIAIDQSLIPKFTEILNRSKSKTDSTFTVTLPDGSIYSHPGYISFIDRAVDATTGTIKARIVFNNPEKMLKVGATASIRVENKSDSATIVIPYKCIVEQLGEFFVYQVQDTIALQKKVVLGSKINGTVIVKDGLKAGDVVVTDGVQKLRDSSAIHTGVPKAPAQPSQTK
ncbi:MAG: efflux RND transporter periplasmic adaptor subunit [Parafilimonas sp.]